MEKDTTRRAVLAAVLGAGAGGTALFGSDLLDSFAPLNGRAWRGSRNEVPDTVSSPHGDATVTYDDYGVPHVEAETEEAAYYAVGFVHAADRLFQMDLIRRLMDGRLSEVVGEETVESDVFHTKMDFRGAAEASGEAVSGSRAETVTEAYTEGVNEYIETGPEPLEFGLLGYEADEWTVTDTLLVGAQISWGLTGSFNDLRRAYLRDELDADTFGRLYGEPYDHGAPIIRESETDAERVDGVETARDVPTTETEVSEFSRGVEPEMVDWLAESEPPPLWGSNHWAVSGEHTDTGAPMLAYDPHLSLTVPPVWYEQHVTVTGGDGDEPEVEVRGATFPGIPFAIVGENRHGAWGFTNSGADVLDVYTYETDDENERYMYDGNWRDFETETRTVEVADGEDREIEVKRTVHGVFIDREVAGETRHVGVRWTGMSGTRESEAVYEFGRTTDVDDYLEAVKKMDIPTQNALYVDDSGNVLYKLTGSIPIRRDEDGEVIRGDRVFDGSAGEAEWDGFEPFGESSWNEGFVPFEDKPGVLNPDYVGTANQRIVDNPTYPIGYEYADGFRGERIYERLDERVGSDEPVDDDFMKDLQTDSLDIRARILVPAVLEARELMPDSAETWLDAMEDWDYRMERDSEAAVAFHRFYDAFRRLTWEDDFEELDLGESWWPRDRVLVSLPPDDEHFDGDRAGVMADAMEEAIAEIEEERWEVYGDYNVTAIDHEFGGQVDALNYPRYPTDGTGSTVMNFHDGASAGASWRQVSPMDDETESSSVIPGGQSASYFSDHYDDQLSMWADGEYKEMSFEMPEEGDVIRFRGEDG
jgi:penicillin amidase